MGTLSTLIMQSSPRWQSDIFQLARDDEFSDGLRTAVMLNEVCSEATVLPLLYLLGVELSRCVLFSTIHIQFALLESLPALPHENLYRAAHVAARMKISTGSSR